MAISTHKLRVTPFSSVRRYQISTLRLNRPLLRRQRELRMLMEEKLEITAKKWQAIVEGDAGTDHAKTAAEALRLLEAIQLLVKPQSKRADTIAHE